jgi:hypothetical protein
MNKEKIKRGKTEAETLKLNGWKEGDILAGDEGQGDDYILITRIGEDVFLCRWKYGNHTDWQKESGQTTLSCREWRKVGAEGEFYYNCLICQRPVEDYEPEMCCSGSGCGCMGQPTEPCICSKKCAGALFKIEWDYEDRRKSAGIPIFKPHQ